MFSALTENNLSNANAFNKYCINISSSIHFILKFFRNRFNEASIKPIDKIEVKNIILYLNPLKAVGSNSIPIKILKLLS